MSFPLLKKILFVTLNEYCVRLNSGIAVNLVKLKWSETTFGTLQSRKREKSLSVQKKNQPTHTTVRAYIRALVRADLF